MATKKNITPDRSVLISKYSDHCLTHGSRPESVFKFAIDHGFEEVLFYRYFSSFDALENEFFVDMFTHTLEILEKTPSYSDYSGIEKMSAFYFTFFDLATANRSFVTFALKEGGHTLRNLVKLKKFRRLFLAHAGAVLEKPFETHGHKVGKVQDAALREGAWLQLLSILKFWMDDTSPSFEKTDIFIEKSVKASADIVYNSPLQSIVDLGKFIWKEKFTA
ncbi:TetR family transcriptional regulator C-terminal domain-containing protein [uncultured Flavobacterium sp.]|uniref:TetR family transcriptional regulator C-terminal domain-containing protein n=1 Tax=uncultured Flavobacterium sp. TaxID=165435 RepID=UPI0025E188FD|nr:TetR family transcriptional regulator C-terminal domain-containing protein [uncultured Flavobacterium sp.]